MSLECDISQTRGKFSLELKMSLPSKGVTAIFGPSGSGKTSLLRAISGLDFHANNKVSFNNATWQDCLDSTPVHQRGLAYVFQEPSLFAHLNVLQNLEYAFNRASEKEPKFTIESVVEHLNLTELLGRHVGALSGGERQRVAIGRALCSSPKLLLMDEPLAALDRKTKRQLLSLLDSICRQWSLPIIYVSHSLDEVARLADELVLLEQGRVKAQGDIQSMLSSLDYSLARDPQAESVIISTLVSNDERFGLRELSSPIGPIVVPYEASQNDLLIGDQVRVLIAARDVSITLVRQQNTSVLNIFEGEIESFIADDGCQLTVKVMINEVPLLARITKKSMSLLNLSVGDTVFLQAKSVALL